MTRKEARETVFKLLFEYEVQKSDANEILERYYDINSTKGSQTDYIDNLVRTSLSNIDQIDMLISDNSKTRSHVRISRVSLAALRVGLCEMLFTELDDNIAISEAVRISKEYEGEKASAFVNGVMSTVYKVRMSSQKESNE